MKLTAAIATMILAFCANQIIATPTPSMRFRPDVMRKATGEVKHPYIIPQAVLQNMDLKRCLAEWDNPKNKSNAKPNQKQDKVMQQLQKAFKESRYSHIHIKAEPKPSRDRFIKRVEKYIDTLKKVVDNAKKKKNRVKRDLSADEYISTPADEAIESPADEYTSAPADEAIETPADEYTATPADEAIETPADEYTATPADEAIETPADEYTAIPADEAIETPADEYTATPADEAIETPADEAIETPADEAIETPADEAIETPADEAIETPADEAIETPADEAIETPADEAIEIPADEYTATPADEAIETPADEAIETPADEYIAVPADESVLSPPAGMSFSKRDALPGHVDELDNPDYDATRRLGKRDVKIQGGCKKPEDVLVALLQVELKQGPRRFGGPMGPRRMNRNRWW